MEKILDNLYLHTLDAIESNDLRTVEKNLAMFTEILLTVINNSQQPSKLSINEEWFKYINKLGEKLIRANLIIEEIDYLIDLYKKVNGDIFLKLEYTLNQLLMKIKDMDSYDSIRNLKISTLFRTIFSYTKESDVHIYYTRYFHVIMGNRHLIEEDKHSLLTDMFVSVFYLKYSKEDVRNDSKRAILLIIVHFIKQAIDKKNIQLLSSLLKEYNHSNFLLKEFTDTRLVNLLLLIYLYYIAIKEPLVPEEDKAEFNKILEHYGQTIYEGIGYLEVNAETLDSISRIMDFWEIMDKYEAKALLLGSVIKEVLFFLRFISYSGFSDEIIENKDELFSFLSSNLKENGDLTDSLRENYSIFTKYVHSRDVKQFEIDAKMEKLIENYKNTLISEAEMYRNKKISEDLDKLNSSIKMNIMTSPLLELDGQDLKEKDTFIHNINIPTVIDLSDFHLDETLLDNIVGSFEFLLLHILVKKGAIAKPINYDYKEKINLLITSVNKFKTDTLLNGIDEVFLYDEGDETLNNFRNFMRKKIKYIFPAKNHVWVGINKDYFKFSLSKVAVYSDVLSERDINQLLEKSKIKDRDSYKIRLMNNIHTVMEKEEAVKWFSITKSKLVVQIDFTYEFEEVNEEESKGFIIQLVQ